MLKCVECGHIFEWGEEERWSEGRGECHGFPASEDMVGCPICRGVFEETEACSECGGEFLKEELFEELCVECIAKHITYDKALEFLTEEDKLCDFIFTALWKTVPPVLITQELQDAVREIYLRNVADDKIRNVDAFLKLIKNYILNDYKRKTNFVYYI